MEHDILQKDLDAAKNPEAQGERPEIPQRPPASPEVAAAAATLAAAFAANSIAAAKRGEVVVDASDERLAQAEASTREAMTEALLELACSEIACVCSGREVAVGDRAAMTGASLNAGTADPEGVLQLARATVKCGESLRWYALKTLAREKLRALMDEEDDTEGMIIRRHPAPKSEG